MIFLFVVEIILVLFLVDHFIKKNSTSHPPLNDSLPDFVNDVISIECTISNGYDIIRVKFADRVKTPDGYDIIHVKFVIM